MTSRDGVYLAHKRLSLACWVSIQPAGLKPAEELKTAGRMDVLEPAGTKKKGTPTIADAPCF